MPVADLARRVRCARRRASRCGLGALGDLDRRHVFLRRGHRQFGRRRFTNFDRNADGRRLIDRAGFVRIGISSFAGKARDFRRRVAGSCRRVGQFAQAIEFIGALEGGEDKELPLLRGGDRDQAARRAPAQSPSVNGARDPSGGLSARTRIKMARSTPPTGRIRRIGSIACA